MVKKIKITNCIGCLSCITLCPELFAVDEAHHVYNLYGDDFEIPEDLESSVLDAIDSCPVCALTIIEE